ncbi:hypothetical protein ABZS66_36895 [Dactylosporangium sp. NPDC005572]
MTQSNYAGNPRLQHVTPDTDHALSERRITLIQTVAAFPGGG